MSIKTLVIGAIGIVIGVLLTTAASVLAGNPAGPGTAPALTRSYTLEDVYNSLNTGAAVISGTFAEPAAWPVTGTMRTLNDLYALTRQRAPAPNTGQAASYGAGDDGALQRGVAWPNPRFTDNGNGTVMDNMTGLIWLKNANCFGQQVWSAALSSANGLASGSCGLADGSTAGQWRLPNMKELRSLIDHSHYNPVLPSGHPFTGVQSSYYWSATSNAVFTSYAWFVALYDGYVNYNGKAYTSYVWPVRGGQ